MLDTAVTNAWPSVDVEAKAVSDLTRNLSYDDMDWIFYTFDLESSYEQNSANLKVESMGRPALTVSTGMFNDNKKRSFENYMHSGFQTDINSPDSQSTFGSMESGNFTTPVEYICKRSKLETRKRSVESENSLLLRSMPQGDFTEGRWRPDEIALLMYVTEGCATQELRIICDICYGAGLRRPRRAIDKQLKRMLKYEKWASRDVLHVRAQIAGFAVAGKLDALCPEQAKKACRCKAKWDTQIAEAEAEIKGKRRAGSRTRTDI